MPRPYGVVDFVYCGNRKVPPHQSPAVTASPRGGSLCKLLLSAAQFGGNPGQSGLLFTAQFAAPGLLSAAQFGGCYPRHSLVFPRGGCYSRHSSKPLLFTAHFPFLCGKPGCYRRHICVWGCYSRHNSAGLLSAAQLPLPAALCPFKYNAVSPVLLRGVVKHSTIPGVVIGSTFPLFCCCYPQHISFLGCYRRHNSKNVVIYGTVWKKAGLLFAAHFVLGLLDSAQLW